MITPFLYMVSTSFKPNLLAFEWPPRFIPDPATIDNYVTAWSANNFARYFANSVLDACATTFATTLLAALAAYAFARFTFPGRSLLFWAGYRHAHLIAPTQENADPLGQPISMVTVRALSAALRRGGTLPLGYGVGKHEWPEWEHLALLRPDGTPYELGGICP
jgi:hypothetical protein